VTTQTYKVHGLDCVEEVTILKNAVGPVIGGPDQLSFDVLNGRMTVAGETPAAIVIDAVRRTGMRAEPWSPDAKGDATHGPARGPGLRTWTTVASGVLTAVGFSVHAWTAGSVIAALGSEGLGQSQAVPILSRLLYAAAAASGAWFVLPKATHSVRALRPDMNLLMTLAVAGAMPIDEWLEAATVAFLFAVSIALEAWSVGRARRAVEALLDLAPATARVVEDGRVSEVAADTVPVGARVSVRPGERVPLDGVVASGASHVNQAPITGESVPVWKDPGAPVYAGSVNGDGALELTTTKPASDSTLAHIIALVGQAQQKRGPAEQWVERFARVYTPAVLALAVLVAVLPPLLTSQSWLDWGYRALVLLVIGCPCALVISTPVTIVAGVAAAARHGVLIKGGAYLEAAGRAKAIALDKTGTLTEGRPRVTAVLPLDDHTEAMLLARAAALEAESTHPIARAILDRAAADHVDVRRAEDAQAVPGKGVTGVLDGKRYWLGSHRYLEERAQETPVLHAQLEALSSAGQTVVVVGTDAHVCGLIAIADALRRDARRAVESLHAQGVDRVVMLTGDNAPTARAIARDVGIDDVHAELLPADKVRVIDELVARYGTVGMVGDGINDTPAMARASFAVAMGAAGSDAAIETADIALMSDELSKLAWLIGHSRRALGIIRANIALSLAVKAIFAALTFAGHASLWAAIMADMGVSLLVIGNALRLTRSGRSSTPARQPEGVPTP
jgi:Zn2+/Cd2+-exporting ATPase